MNCLKCKNLLVKTTVGLLKKNKKSQVFECYFCHRKDDNEDFMYIYYCFKCNKSVCKQCTYKFNIKDIKNLSFPKAPLFLDEIEKEIKGKIKNDGIKQNVICKQHPLRITTKKDSGNIICVYLKTLIGKIYTINIDDGHDIGNLKEELRKIDNKYKEDKTLLIYKNKMLKDNDCLIDLGIDNESLINIVLK